MMGPALPKKNPRTAKKIPIIQMALFYSSGFYALNEIIIFMIENNETTKTNIDIQN